MAIFDYQCLECATIREEWHGINENPIPRCHCGGLMRKVMSPVRFHLPVYRPEELLKKKDTPTAEQDYKRKLSKNGWT